jgi:hypothetical protein
VPNLMQMSSNKGLRSLALGSAHEKFDLSNVFNKYACSDYYLHAVICK